MAPGVFYDALIWTVLGLLGMAVGLTVATLLHHGFVALRLLRRARRGAILLPLLCQAIEDPERSDELVSQLRRGDAPVLLPMLLQLGLDLRGDELERVAEFGETLGLVRAERRRLHSWYATERAEAAKNLGLLQVRAALPDLLRLTQRDRRRPVRIASAWAVGEIGGADAVRGLLALLDDRDGGIVRRAQEVLLNTAPEAAGDIVRHAHATESRSARLAAVELLGALRDPVASELLLEYGEAADEELRIKAAKAAAAIGDPRFLEMFGRLLHDPLWSVRCQAATGLGSIGAVDAIADLREALTDAVWWVRFNAASSLAGFGAPGRAALAEATTDANPRQREVACYVLQRTGLERRAA